MNMLYQPGPGVFIVSVEDKGHMHLSCSSKLQSWS